MRQARLVALLVCRAPLSPSSLPSLPRLASFPYLFLANTTGHSIWARRTGFCPAGDGRTGKGRTFFTAARLSKVKPKYDAHRSAPSSSPANNPDEEEMRRWREQAKALERRGLRIEDVEISFSRSSGPGGQNVNKLSTKATLRLDLKKAAAFLPDFVVESALRSPYYVTSSHSLLVSSQRSRTQDANVEDALSKLSAHLLTLASSRLTGETSPEQRERVRRLAAAEDARRKEGKKKRGDVKRSRGRGAIDW